MRATEELKSMIFRGTPFPNGRMPFDEIEISKTDEGVMITYYYKNKAMLSQTVAANLDAGNCIHLPDHIGSVGFRLES